jgi:hypothetical protein
MIEIGLKPVNVHNPKKQTGKACSHEIVAGGRFDVMFQRMNKTVMIPLRGMVFVEIVKKKRSDKIKYTCPECELNVWGRSGLGLKCLICEQQLIEEFQEQSEIEKLLEL